MVYVFKLKDGREYHINSERVNITDNDLNGWLQAGVKNNLPFKFFEEDLTFKDLKAVEILLHETIEYK